MRKLLYLLLVIPTLLMAQNRPDWDYDIDTPISAFFPQRLPFFADNYIKAQNTYCEYNWVSNNLKTLIKKRLNLNYVDAENKTEDTYIIDVYKTSAGRTIDKLVIKYNVFVYYGLYVVSSVEISGSHAQVTSLFINLYDTWDVQSGDKPTNNFIKSFGQEDAVYTIGNGKASIKITNSAYENNADFKANFETLKEKYKADKIAYDLQEEVRRIENEKFNEQRKKDWEQYQNDKIEKRKQDSIHAVKATTPRIIERPSVYYFSKSGSRLKFLYGKEPNDEIKKLIYEKAINHKRGNYSAYVVTVTSKDEISYKIKINESRK